MQHLHIAVGQVAPVLHNQGRGAGLLQHVFGHLVRQRGIQQNGLIPCGHQPPKRGEPVPGGFHLDGDIAAAPLLTDGPAQVRAVVHADILHLGKGERFFLVVLQPVGGHQVAFADGDGEEVGHGHIPAQQLAAGGNINAWQWKSSLEHKGRQGLVGRS